MTSRILVLAPVFIGLTLSIVMALVLGNPLALLFGLTMPLMALVPVLEKWVTQRRERRDLPATRARERTAFPSPSELLDASGDRVPMWASRTGAGRLAHLDSGAGPAPDHSVRVGLCTATGEVVRIEIASGIEVCGVPGITAAAARALSAGIAWVFGRDDSAPQVYCTPSNARWLLAVRATGEARLSDRWGREDAREGILVDILTQSEANRFAELVSSFAAVDQLRAIEWDLFTDGPHALVSGVTGSGKTVFLRQWIRHLVSEPTATAVAIIDFKGGGGFADLVDMPGVRHCVSNLHSGGVQHALSGLSGLMVRRQILLAEHGVLDIEGLPLRQSGVERVVVVVDEYRALLEAHPEAHAVFADIAARGRALGIHLVLSTQRFTGVASDALVSNCSLRIVFRAGDENESRQLLGSACAFDSTLEPGHGFVVRPGIARVAFRLPLASGAAPQFGAQSATRPRDGEPLWLEPLPQPPCWTDVQSETRDEIVLGLIDDQVTLERRPVRVGFAHAGVLIVSGGDATARDDLVRQIADQIGADQLGADPVAIWDTLSEAGAVDVPLCIDNLDAAQAALPTAWREEFLELVLTRLRESVATNRPCVVSLTGSNAVLARLTQRAHTLIVLNAHGCYAELAGQKFAPCTPRLTEHERAMPVHSIRAELPRFDCDDVRPGILITPFVQRWESIGLPGTAVVSCEDWIFGKVARSAEHRIFVDGCTPAEARALRLSAHTLPPPSPHTVLEVLPTGEFRRRALDGVVIER